MDKKRKKLKIEQADITPICPHCDKEIEKLIEVSRGFMSINRVFCCPNCHKIVGVSSGQ